MLADELRGRACSPAYCFDGDGNRVTLSHAVKKGTRYRYYVSRPLITTAQSP